MRRAVVLFGSLLVIATAGLPARASNHADRAGSAGQPLAAPTRVWTARYDEGAKADEAKAVAVSPDGTRAFVTGEGSTPGRDEGYVTIAYDASSGAQLWESRYDGPGNGTCDFDIAHDIAVSPDGTRVFVTGISCGIGDDYATVAYDASSGAQRWVARFALGYEAEAIGVSPDGTLVYVTGYDVSRWHTIAYDAETGAEVWLSQYVGAGFEAVVANGLQVSPDGARVYVTGYFWSGSSDDDALVAYDAATGFPIWSATYDSPGEGEDTASALAVSADGSRVYVTGTASPSIYSPITFGTEAFDAATGSLLWAATYDGPGTGNDVANDVGVSPDGSVVYVTGSSYGSTTGIDYATVAYAATDGSQLWVGRFDGSASGDDRANALAVGPSGRLVYVTGQSIGSGTGLDYATIAYRANTGQQAWLLTYDGPGHGNDQANDIAVDRIGRSVFVTGGSKGAGTGEDYATIGRISG
jgi:DNA-binding beta-propeller fold protein YncE